MEGAKKLLNRAVVLVDVLYVVDPALNLASLQANQRQLSLFCELLVGRAHISAEHRLGFNLSRQCVLDITLGGDTQV